jgi:hypothetical protein
MGVRVANRSKRTLSSPLWEVSYHLPSAGNGALASYSPRTAPIPLQDDPAVLQERERLQKRRELIGRNVRLPREWADVLNPSSPVALQPRFRWLEWAGKSRWHEELRWMRWATVLPSGEVLKAYTEEGLEKLRDTVLRVKPTMEHFGLVVPVFYQNHGRTWTGGCSPEEEFEGITIPEVIRLSTKVSSEERVWNLLHELGHLGQVYEGEPNPKQPPPYHWWEWDSERDYQRTLHPEEFRRRHGEILAYYLEHHADYWENRALRYWAEVEQDYSPPIHPDGRAWRVE